MRVPTSERGREAWAEAESLAAAILGRIEGTPGADSLQLATALFGLGEARYELATWGSDIPLRDVARSFEIRRRRLPENHPDIATSLAMLGVILIGVDNDSALVLTRSALDLRLRQPVPSDSALADSWLALGELYIFRGEPQSAVAALEKGLELERRVFGPRSPRLAIPLSTLGEAWYSLDDLERAVEVTEEGLGLLDPAGSTDRHDRINLLACLQKFNMARGDLGRAFDAGQEAVRLAEASGDTVDIVASRNNLAVVLGQFGDEEGARRILEAALPLCDSADERLRGAASTMRQVLGVTCSVLGDTAAALRYFTEGMAGPRLPGIGTITNEALCILGQGSVMYAQHRYREALVLLRRGIEMNEATAQPDLVSMVTARTQGIQYLEALGDSAGVDSARADLAALRDRLSLRHTGRGPIIADWMRRLYEARARGERRGPAALRTACRRILTERRGSGRPTHPFYWAAFTATGG